MVEVVLIVETSENDFDEKVNMSEDEFDESVRQEAEFVEEKSGIDVDAVKEMSDTLVLSLLTVPCSLKT